MLRPESLHALCAAFQKRPEDVQVDGVAGGLIAPGVAEIGAGITVPPHQPPHFQRQLASYLIVDGVFEMDRVVAIAVAPTPHDPRIFATVFFRPPRAAPALEVGQSPLAQVIARVHLGLEYRFTEGPRPRQFREAMAPIVTATCRQLAELRLHRHQKDPMPSLLAAKVLALQHLCSRQSSGGAGAQL